MAREFEVLVCSEIKVWTRFENECETNIEVDITYIILLVPFFSLSIMLIFY